MRLSPSVVPALVPTAALLALLLCDQLVEPPHFSLAALQTQPVQLPGVAVDLLTRAGHGRAQTLPPLLHPTPPTFQDSHPDLGRCPGEERHVDAEPLVVPCLRAGVGQQLGEALLALGGA